MNKKHGKNAAVPGTAAKPVRRPGVTGMAHMRDQSNMKQRNGDPIPTDGRQLVQVCMVIAVPKDTIVPFEKMMTVSGEALAGTLTLRFTGGEKPNEPVEGFDADQLMLSTIWRL